MLFRSETAQKKYLEGWKATINEANGYVNNVSNGTVVTTQEKAASDAQAAQDAAIAECYRI